MSLPDTESGGLSQEARALIAMRKMKAKLEASERARTEPIAVVGLACRFPGGANSPEAFWRLLESSRDAVSEVPSDRWRVEDFFTLLPEGQPRQSARWGAFLDDVSGFDASFWNISPREATAIDPQQRLLLEVNWEAIEDAGYSPESLAGSQTGVFTGLYNSDYEHLQFHTMGASDQYATTGTAKGFAAGRLSYLLDLHGPTMVIDTICSSSLVSVHMAMLSLRAGDCDVALASGVNLILAPGGTIMTSKLLALSPDGRCRTFDARANGYVRGEGCGAVVLKRLSDAQAQGDTIRAVLRGSAINHDGRSNGLTAPNASAQAGLLRRALRNAGVTPDQITHIEAHGTGTPLGDPIEVEALCEVYGRVTPPVPCALTSVKTNMGHLEPASGIAGLIKVILSLQHHRIPGHLHFRHLNPRITLEGTRFYIPTEGVPWPAGDAPRRAALSSFGMSGTNVHVIVEESPQRPEDREVGPEPGKVPHLFVLSARSPQALRAYVERTAAQLAASPEGPLGDLCTTAQLSRSGYVHRLAAVATTRPGLHQALVALASEASEGHPGVGLARPDGPRLAFLFTGQGSQYPGMGSALYRSEPVFRSALDQCAAFLDRRIPRSLLSVLFAEGEDTHLGDTAFTQPALFSLEYALAQFWASWGIHPHTLLGHSVGEYVAACLAGVFGLEDALTLVAERGHLMQSLPATGAMAAILTGESVVLDLLQEHRSRAGIAALNGPEEVVVSGDRQAVQEVLSQAEQRGLRTRRLKVSHAFHSHHMEPILDDFRRVLQKVHLTIPRVGVVSNLTGRVEREALADPEYWVRHLRSPVRFAEGARIAVEEGCDAFLELGPDPLLLGLIRKSHPDHAAVWLPSLRRGRDEASQVLNALGSLYVQGASVDWETANSGRDFRRVPLPTYPFQRRPYWAKEARATLSVPMRPDRVLGNTGQTGEQSPEAAEQIGTDSAKSIVPVRFLLEWEKKAHPGGASETPGAWLLWMDDGPVGPAIRSHLEARGQRCSTVVRGQGFAETGPGTFEVHPERLADYQTVVRTWMEAARAPRLGILHLWSLDPLQGRGPAEDLATGANGRRASSALLLCQAVVSAGGVSVGAGRAPELWWITAGAVAQSLPPEDLSLDQAPVWGLGRVAALEHFSLRSHLVDVTPGSLQEVPALVQELVQPDGEDQVLFRGQTRLVPRWIADLVDPPPPSALHPDRTYLVSGMGGPLGPESARWLVALGARSLVLVGESVQETFDQELRAQGVEAIWFPNPAPAEGARWVEQLASRLKTLSPVAGLIHSASPWTVTPLAELSPEALDAAIQTEVVPALLLESLVQESLVQGSLVQESLVQESLVQESLVQESLVGDQKLDFFVTVSSITSVIGLGGMGHHAAAQSVLAQRLEQRASSGLPALSLHVGSWDLPGLLPATAARAALATGLHPIGRREGNTLLAGLLGLTGARSIAAIDLPTFKPLFEIGRPRRILERLSASEPTKGSERTAIRPDLLRKLKNSRPLERTSLLVEIIQAEVGRVMQLDTGSLPDPRQGLFQMGMDSLMAIELKTSLEQTFGLALSATLALDYPNIEALASFLLREIPGLAEAPPVEEAADRGDAERGALLSKIRDLSERELEALVDEELSSLMQ